MFYETCLGMYQYVEDEVMFTKEMKSGFYGSISCPILIKDDTLNCRGSMP
jgi:hypothetical protein